MARYNEEFDFDLVVVALQVRQLLYPQQKQQKN